MNMKKIISKIRALGFAMIFLISNIFIPVAYAEGTGIATLTIEQTLTSESTPPSDIFTYKLIPKSSNNPPLPAGGDTFSISGAGDEVKINFTSTNVGLYIYELKCVSSAQSGYTYDQSVYTIEMYRLSDDRVIIIARNSAGEKAEVHFKHSYETPTQIYHNIIYKNYDGTNLNIVDPTYPKVFTEGLGIPALPTVSPTGWMPGYDLYGLYDCPLDRNRKVPIGVVGYEGEESLNFNIGNKITSISTTAKSDVILYLRPWSQMVDQDLNGRENYLYAPYGVFPNGSWANIRTLDPESSEYQTLLPEVEEKGKTKIVEFEVFDENDVKIQPNTFFGFIVLGFRVTEGFNVNNIKIWRVLVNGMDIQLRDRVWVDPTDPTLWYIEGYTDRLSPYAIVTPEDENKETGGNWWDDVAKEVGKWVTTGDNSWIVIIGLSLLLIISAGILIWISRKKKSEKK